MKNDKLNYTEIENLSAYLDHELSEVEENQLKGRLAHDAQLRDKLEDLRLTRYTLRHTPKVQRRRSFTLSPEMVQKQKSAWFALNVSRMVSVAASVLFVLVLGGQLIFGGGAGMLASAPAENASMMQDSAEMEAPMAMEAPAEEAVEEAAMEPMAAELVEEPAAEESSDLADHTPEAMGMGGGIEPTPTIQATEIAAVESELQPTATEFGIGGGAPPTETPVPPSDSAAEERLIPSEKTVEQDQVFETGPAEGDEAMPGDGDMAETTLISEKETPQVSFIPWVLGGLLVLALLSGGAAIYFRRIAR